MICWGNDKNHTLPRGENTLNLKGYLKTCPLVLIRYKCQALLMREKGMKLKDIADIVSRDEQTIGRWIKDFSATRMASIFTGHKDNENASKLTKLQKQQIKETLREPPSAHGLSKEFWDVPTLKEYVSAQCGVVYESVQSYHFLLQFCNLRFKYPDTFDHRRDEAYIGKRMEEIHEEIGTFPNKSEWEVFVADEVRMQLEAITRRAWLKRGERTVLKVNRSREAQNYLGLLNQKSFVCEIYELAWQNQQEVLRALELFVRNHPEKRICIVWDNARFHKGQEIRKALGTGGLLERVHLINLPPYAPDRNPIEHVWKAAKDAIANVQYDAFQETKEAFRSFIQGRIFKYQI